LREVMSISLGGGATGTDTGGMTQMGGRAVQTQTPPDAPKRPEPIRAPAAKAPEMTVPAPNAARQPRAAPVTQAPKEARGSTPTRGAEPSPGTAVAETGVRGQGFGLATGGGMGSGSRLDVGNFCCPEYLNVMVQRIRTNWNERAETPGQTWVKFTIQRDGRLTDVALDQPSAYLMHNQSALRAVLQTKELPPLPNAFPNPTLTVYLNFQYTR
jgi:TonB family protein